MPVLQPNLQQLTQPYIKGIHLKISSHRGQASMLEHLPKEVWWAQMLALILNLVISKTSFLTSRRSSNKNNKKESKLDKWRQKKQTETANWAHHQAVQEHLASYPSSTNHQKQVNHQFTPQVNYRRQTGLQLQWGNNIQKDETTKWAIKMVLA